MKKDSMVLYLSHYKSFKNLSLEDKGKLLDSLFYYLEFEQVPTDMTPLVQMAFSFIRNQMDIDTSKYLDKCRKNRESIQKRYERIQTNTNATDKDKDNDKEKDKDINKESKPKKNISLPPTPSLSNKEIINQKCLQMTEELKPFLEEFGKDTLNDFFQYWTEPVQPIENSKGKIRKDLERTWDIKRRLSTWVKRSNQNGFRNN